MSHGVSSMQSSSRQRECQSNTLSTADSHNTYTHARTPAPHTYIHTQRFNGPLSGTIRVSRYQKGKTNLDFTEARDSEWQWHQLGHMQICISVQTDNLARTPPLSFLQAGCTSGHPTNSVKALKANTYIHTTLHYNHLTASFPGQPG